VTSARLTLRPIALDDFEPYHEFLNDPACLRYLLHPEPHAPELSRRLLERDVARHDGRIGWYTILDGEEILGWAGYSPRSLDWGDELELGWLIRRRHWGNGCASEAARRLRALGPERVVHLIHPENAASIAVARKLGATWERNAAVGGAPAAVYVSNSG
jgi:RimJ/RimL family protein N-acetyltransferase